LSTTPEFNETQLAGARKKGWHQAGEALLTLEDAKAWVAECGVVLFAPQTRAVATAAPSLVEATLGTTNAAPTAAELDVARGFVARMVADGSVVPLNLLGGPGDEPDFVVSAQVFPYIFTLRGDKAWKQPPSTSGAVKVSPLALKVYETLAEKGAMTAAELALELGREVTEPAILRSLVELWTQLRVLPLLQQGEGATMWELTSKRFTKAIKSGANAGQPTALSALISLYLARVIGATEEEIETFLSPLTSRSRVREVLHALTAGRQLETVVVEGKTLLYIPGSLPEFAPVVVEVAEGEGEGSAVAEEGSEGAPKPFVKDEGRIRRFEGKRPAAGARREYAPREGYKRERPSGDRPAGGGFAAKRGEFPPKRREGGDWKSKPAGERKPYAPRTGGYKRAGDAAAGARPERERRPFNREGASGEKREYTKPWQEDRKPRTDRGAAGGWKGSTRRTEGEGGGAEERRPRREFSAGGARAPYERKPRAEGDRPQRSYAPREGGDRPKRSYTPREGGDRPQRSYTPREGGERPQRRSYTPREGGDRPQRSYTPREGGDRPQRRAYTPREGGDRPQRSYTPREGGDRPQRSYTPREGGERPRSPRPYVKREGGSAEGGERKSYGDRKPFGSKPGFKSAKPAFGSKPKFGSKPGFKSSKPGFGSKPGFKGGKSGFGGAKKSFGAKGSFGPKGSSAPRGGRPGPRKSKPGAEE
jgi:23S rRNA pseudouridine2605 synthase